MLLTLFHSFHRLIWVWYNPGAHFNLYFKVRKAQRWPLQSCVFRSRGSTPGLLGANSSFSPLTIIFTSFSPHLFVWPLKGNVWHVFSPRQKKQFRLFPSIRPADWTPAQRRRVSRATVGKKRHFIWYFISLFSKSLTKSNNMTCLYYYLLLA